MRVLKMLILIFFIGLQVSNAQRKNVSIGEQYYVDISLTDSVQSFDRIVELLVSSPYFIGWTDKDSGLIQCEIVGDLGKVFGKYRVDVLQYNLLVKEQDQKSTRIYIQANLKERRTDSGSDAVYLVDMGVTNRAKHYEPFMEFLKANL